MLKNILKFLTQHKVAAGVFAILIIGGGYYGYQAIFSKTAPPRYVLAAAEKGTLIFSVIGSGQVSASNQVDIRAKVSGDVVLVGVKNSQEVKSGTLLAQINSADAVKAVNDAETSLETAKLELDKLLAPLDELTLLQAENSLTQLKESKQNLEDDFVKAYEDGFNSVVNSFFDLPGIMADLEDIIYGKTINKTQDNVSAYADMIKYSDDAKVTAYKNSVIGSFVVARAAYDKNFQDYKTVGRYSDHAAIEAIINATYNTSKAIAEAIRNTDNLISFVKDTLAQRGLDIPKIIATHQATVKTDTGKMNSILSNLLGAQRAIESGRETIVKTDRSIREKELSLADLKAGADELAIRAKKIAVQQKQDALSDARQKLVEYFIRAPFDAVAAKVNVKKGDSILSGAAIATVITKQKIAEITLNEVDVAKIRLGQKTTVTFDAVADLTIAGAVADIDTIGMVSQGVVSYNIKISFDTEDDRVKPGMSVSAAIVTDITLNVLTVPNAAVKISGNSSYVEILDCVTADEAAANPGGVVSKNTPRRQSVETGSANDSLTEITGGLSEGDLIVTRTITAAAANQSTQQRSILQSIGGQRSGTSGGGRAPAGSVMVH